MCSPNNAAFGTAGKVKLLQIRLYRTGLWLSAPHVMALYSNYIPQILTRLNSMLRKIQNLAELEQRWESEQKDVQNNTTKAADAFFASYHLVEVTL